MTKSGQRHTLLDGSRSQSDMSVLKMVQYLFRNQNKNSTGSCDLQDDSEDILFYLLHGSHNNYVQLKEDDETQFRKLFRSRLA